MRLTCACPPAAAEPSARRVRTARDIFSARLKYIYSLTTVPVEASAPGFRYTRFLELTRHSALPRPLLPLLPLLKTNV